MAQGSGRQLIKPLWPARPAEMQKPPEGGYHIDFDHVEGLSQLTLLAT